MLLKRSIATLESSNNIYAPIRYTFLGAPTPTKTIEVAVPAALLYIKTAVANLSETF